MTADVAVVIVAGGKGVRMRDSCAIPKQYMSLCGKSVLLYSIDLFLQCPCVFVAQVVAQKKDEIYYRSIVKNHPKLLPVCPAGNLRQDSVFAGLIAVQKYKPKYVIVHDAVRPLVTNKIIEGVIAQLKNGKKAVAPAVCIDDTVAIKNHHTYCVESFVSRDKLHAIQTPQGFNFENLLRCYKKSMTNKNQYTDETSLVKEHDTEITLIPGDKQNVKITTASDLKLCEFYIKLMW